MRAHALRTFAEWGGSRSLFDRYWPETFESTLRDSYGARTGDVPDEEEHSEAPGR